MSKIQNRAFKMWLSRASGGSGSVMAKLILDALGQQSAVAFEIMDEAEFDFEGYDKAAQMVLQQTSTT